MFHAIGTIIICGGGIGACLVIYATGAAYLGKAMRALINDPSSRKGR